MNDPDTFAVAYMASARRGMTATSAINEIILVRPDVAKHINPNSTDFFDVWTIAARFW